jgi:hypothetical protein
MAGFLPLFPCVQTSHLPNGPALPERYRDWKLITVAHEAGNNSHIRAVLGNDIAVKAFRDSTLDGVPMSGVARA